MKHFFKVKDLINGDARAIEALYESNISIIVAFATSNGCSLDESKEIFHHSLFLLLENLKSGNNQAETNISLYQYSIARVLLKNMLAQKRVDISGIKYNHEFLDINVDEVLEKLATIQKTNQLMKTLAEPGRTILKENVANGIPLAEIAARMNFTSEESAGSNKLKAIQSLMDEL
jgi:DNA-directed RNA polymerase specialized sigma24 family protein